MSKLFDYAEVSAFNESTSLVQRDNEIYVKKQIPVELGRIYKILRENRHKNISNIIEVFEYYAKKIIGQVCDGLIFLHKHNIIHRDINPNNIMITKSGTVKIIDFDISRSVKFNNYADGITQDS